MEHDNTPDPRPVLEKIPSGLFIFTASHDDTKCGVLVRWVQQCSISPPLVMVSMQSGHRMIPVVRDARSFTLCQLAHDDEHSIRRFEHPLIVEGGHAVELEASTSPGGNPVIPRAISFIDCEIYRHVDIEADHELYVGLITHAALLSNEAPAVSISFNGDVAG